MADLQFKTGFIGVGNMGGAILRGFLQTGPNRERVYITARDSEKNRALATELGVNHCRGAKELVEKSDLILLGVKPDMVDTILNEVAEVWQDDKLLVSMAAGVSLDFLESRLHKASAVIRIMPNTPAQIGEGMISLSPNSNVSDRMMAAAKRVLNSVGQVEEVPEDLIHCVIGVSGSSPAYTYMYIEALIEAAVANGMDPETSLKFAAQSVLGAAKMVLESDESPDKLCSNVCSPNGTTIEAVEVLRKTGFQDAVKQGFQAAVDRSIEMTEETK